MEGYVVVASLSVFTILPFCRFERTMQEHLLGTS
jgi:hypothetical protein